MSQNTRIHLRGLFWWNGKPYSVDNSFILYGKVSRAEILATIAFTRYKRKLISYESPNDIVTLDILYTRTVDTRAWLTRKQFENWFKAKIEESEKEPIQNGKMAYIYAIARRQDNCYNLFDFSICVPANIDIGDLYSIIEGGPKGAEYYNFYRVGLQDRIQVGMAGECTFDSDWMYQIQSALKNLVFYKPKGMSRGIICK